MLIIDWLFHENRNVSKFEVLEGVLQEKNKIDVEIEIPHMKSQFKKYLYNKAVWGLTL